MIDPGKMRHQIVFQKFNGTVDSSGDIRDDLDSNWTGYRTVHAAVDPISGRELYQAEQSQSEITHKIRCRYFAGATHDMRILMGTRKFKIISIIDWEERHESYLIMAKELRP